MKKFTFKGVLDGFRQQVQPQMVKPEQEIPETLRPEHFQLKKTFRHGFPHSPTALGYDPVQKLLAIGDKSGSLRVLGKPGVDCHVRHEGESACAVTHIQFLVNEGALITVTADDMLHLWNFRQKSPQVVQSLKFQRERITCLYLPVAAKWLYVGTDKGNIHVINIESFALSGYIINWNKAIEVLRKDRPGAVVSLSDNPTDTNKLLIAYESGTIVLWDLRGKCAEMRWQSTEQLRSVGWHHEGKYFVSSHTDGSLCTWPLRPTPKPQFHSYPHAKTNKDGKLETCKPIHKVDLRTTKMGETFTIFSGGLSVERDGKSPCITVLQGRSTTVLEMEHPVVDFITICESPWSSDMQEPYAIAVLLQNDLVLIDLLTPGFPCFESPYPMDIHESPVTCCTYLADCPSDLVPAFYMVGLNPNNRKAGLSDRQWPISGGGWSPSSCSYFEIIITGHQDGSIKFWDSSAGTLQILYKLKTAKIFDRPRTRSMDGSDDDPLAIQMISLCAESRRLCVAGASGHVILFKFRKAESVSEYLVLEIPISYENFDDPEGSPECEFIPRSLPKQPDSVDTKNDGMLKVRPGPQRKPAGFQAQLVCLTPWTNGTHPGQITALCINSNYGLMAYGTEYGLVIVDIVQKICLLNIASPDLYGAQDPYARTPRSPKRTDATTSRDEQARSPSIDQMNGLCGGPSSSGTVSSIPSLQERTNSATAATGSPIRRGVITAQYTMSSSSDSMRKSRSQGGKKLQKCLSTASYGEELSISRPQMTPLSHNLLMTRQYCSFDKLDSSFSRSRSSSMSSLENISTESVTCLAFADSYTKKSDPSTLLPTLWVGTSLGSVLTISITLPDADARKIQPVLPTIMGGSLFRLKGSILSMSFLDCNGALIPYSYEPWKDENRGGDASRRDRTPTKQGSNRMSPTLGASSSSGSTDSFGDRQFIAITSEKTARVIALPSQNCVYRQQIADTDYVVKAEVISLKDSVCLICYISTGHLIAYSLPSLRQLMDVDFLPLADLSFQTKCKQGIVDPMLSIWGQQLIVHEDTNQISKTFCFSNRGHGLYLATPTEIQKFTVCDEFCQFMNEMIGELFSPVDMPEPPKESFFKGLFGGGARNLDREELFGESGSGKPNRSVAKHIPGPNLQELGSRASTAASEISRAHQLAMERGEKLSQLEDRAERMSNQAQEFSGTAHSLMQKYKDKKWYQL
ncbi:syntaxin-binding protein 5 isoform X9 [Sitodiplosis mosellana]|uniref:syntaxin-binding protein 5 isoform X9 n=1 Tax=Sitodiplosis mosellana TaxID=263140 RepID=UPI00244530ED|nr:syntaxin-binding protein 5 isoform X9 [Sitodiplosis mosellana]XP_055303967.1 syntaxin-binding protein 5 isoform X9 [Sitodiplosis mosellana]XP_055303968.1 syntaxin-binding protein 5 isoform X9 [Sitodiplosis mosellana]XP_055303969.1 syntaxin-binding protein 5 isoform X9 [Sitodiplosis mosellana]